MFEKTLYALAPLAGHTDLPFRRVVKKFGADLTVSEMISSNSLIHGSKKSFKMLEKSDLEDLYSVQICGSSVDVVKQAVEILNEKDGINGIDLNCGCPAPKVAGHGSGSGLLQNLKLMSDIIKTIKKTHNKKYCSVKMRLGYNEKNHIEIAKTIEDAGADFIAIHGRTRKGKYKEEVDYKAIQEVKKSVKIPVIANGDITNVEVAKNVLEKTGADGLMIGRGSLGNPWIFYELKNGVNEINSKLKKEIVLEHFDAMIDFYGDMGLKLFRKHLHSYTKGLKGASEFRNFINNSSEILETRKAIEQFFN